MRSGWVTVSITPAIALASVWRAAKPMTAAAIAPEASTAGGEAVEAVNCESASASPTTMIAASTTPAQEAQARVEHRAELVAAQSVGQPAHPPAHHAVHDRDENERGEQRQPGGDQAARRRVGCDDEGRHGA